MEEDAPPPTIKQEEGISLPGFDYKVDGMDEDAPMDELNALHDETFTASRNSKKKKQQKSQRTLEEEAQRREKLATRKANRQEAQARRRGDSYRPFGDSGLRARDLTPLQGGGESNGIFTEPSDCEKIRLSTLEDSFRSIEKRQLARKNGRRIHANGSERNGEDFSMRTNADFEDVLRGSLADLYRPMRNGDSYRPEQYEFGRDQYRPTYEQASKDTNGNQPEIDASFEGVPRGPRSLMGQSASYGEAIIGEGSHQAESNVGFAGVPTGPRLERPQSNPHVRPKHKTPNWMEAEAETEAALTWSKMTEEERLHGEQKYIKVKGGSHRVVRVDQNARVVTANGNFNEDTYVWKSIPLKVKNKEKALAKAYADSKPSIVGDEMMVDATNEKKSKGVVLRDEAKNLVEDLWEDLPDSSARSAPTFFLPQPSKSMNDINEGQTVETAPAYTSQRITRLEQKRRQEKLGNRKAKRVTEMDMHHLGDLFNSTSLSDAKKTQHDPNTNTEQSQRKSKKPGPKATKREKKHRRMVRLEKKLANKAHTAHMSREDKDQWYLDFEYREWAVNQPKGYKARAHFDEIRRQNAETNAKKKDARKDSKRTRLSKLEESIAEKLIADQKGEVKNSSEPIILNREQIKRDAQEVLKATHAARNKMMVTAAALEKMQGESLKKESKEEQFRKDRDAAEWAMEEKIRQIRMKNRIEGLTKGLGNLLVPGDSED